MATREYIVSFSPAERTGHGFTVALSLLVAGKQHEITAANFADLEKEVRRLAAEFGRTCSPYIRLKNERERKPNGFDAFCDRMHIIDGPTSANTIEAIADRMGGLPI